MARHLNNLTHNEPKKPDIAAHRIMVSETVYHHVHGYQPTASENKFIRRLSSSDQAFGPYRVKVGEEWKRFEKGYIEKVGMIYLVNEPKRYSHQPTAEEREQARHRLVEVGIVAQGFGDGRQEEIIVPFSVFPPGESIRVCPPDFDLIRFRCSLGVTEVTVTILPV